MPSYRRHGSLTVAIPFLTLAFAAIISACSDRPPTAPVASRLSVPDAPARSGGATQPSCPISYGSLSDAMPNKLYLYFPSSDDATYPEFGVSGLTTRPAHRFDAAELPSYSGSTSDLRDGVTNVVIDTYCEFNVQVKQTTSAPPNTFSRRNTVAIGTDAQGPCGGETWGLAQAVDVGDPTAVDFAREWAGSYQLCAGGAGGQLNGANSTLVRWSKAIGGTAAHEAGHNFGLSHTDGLPLAAGEDPLVHHVMASGSHYAYSDRAGYRRHFSDHEYSILAANVGLSVETMWNWDLVNPNAETGRRLQMDFLSTKPSLIMSWSYGGSTSPWINPTVTGPLGTQVFKGVVYNRYRIEWATGHAWANGASGRVPGGAPFHVGATFSGVNTTAPDPIIITDTRLIDSTGTELAIHPRLAGYDAGTLNTSSGFLDIRFFNFDRRPLILQRVNVSQLPRVMSLPEMNPTGRMVDAMGEPFQPWPGTSRMVVERATLDKADPKAGTELAIPVVSLKQAPHVSETITARDCAAQDRMTGIDVAKCNTGVSTDLFPATTLYVTAEIIDPDVKHWDPTKKAYIVGPVTTRLFYQIAGRRLTDKKLQR